MKKLPKNFGKMKGERKIKEATFNPGVNNGKNKILILSIFIKNNKGLDSLCDELSDRLKTTVTAQIYNNVRGVGTLEATYTTVNKK